jgi:hypothetical protein
MTKLIGILSVLVFCVPFAAGQDLSEARSEAKQARRTLIDEFRAERVLGRSPERVQEKRKGEPERFERLAVTDAEVGEADSFNKNAKFFGTATAGVVVVYFSCAEADLGFPLGPDDRCLQITDPTTTTIGTFNDIGRITIPGKKADNVIYGIGNTSISYFLLNSGGTATSGSISYVPSVTIESEALNDPAAVDPSTGLPMNGSFTTSGFGSKFQSTSLQPGQFESISDSYSRAGTRGFSRNYFAALGLPQHVINELYKRPMTIRLNVTVRARRVEDATIFFSIRFLAN